MKKLKKILLINWLHFSKELIEVDDINFLTGANGAGKSTIIDAIQIVLLGETSARNFNQAANEKSQRTLEGYLRADMDEKNPYSRRGKDFTSYIACEFLDEIKGEYFVQGIVFACRSDGDIQKHFFMYNGTIPEHCFIANGIAMELRDFRRFLKDETKRSKVYDSQKEYRKDMVAKWNIHDESVTRLLKKAISFRPITDIEKFITENICDMPDKLDTELMQQNIRQYKRQELQAEQQKKKLDALQEISRCYQEMQQSIERLNLHRFLVAWAQKEHLEEQIRAKRLEQKNIGDTLSQIADSIQETTSKIASTEIRQKELMGICAQSDVAREENRLQSEKQRLSVEQTRLAKLLNDAALKIRHEAGYLSRFCYTASEWEPNRILLPVVEAASSLERSSQPFLNSTFEIFACVEELFQRMQADSSALKDAVQTASHQVGQLLVELSQQEKEKNAALSNLRRNVKQYSPELIQLKQSISEGLKQKYKKNIPVEILADVLEIAKTEERWRGAVEGYLNSQKFYLIVEPAYYNTALHIFNQTKQAFPHKTFGLVDISKLREKEKIRCEKNSLAAKIETSNPLARTYVDYLLGRVICCEEVSQLRQYRTAITADGMLYQGYVARNLRRDQMNNAFIGRHAVELQIQRLTEEMAKIKEQIAFWSPYQKDMMRFQEHDILFTRNYLEDSLPLYQANYIRGKEISEELEQIQTEISHLDLFWLDEQRKHIDRLGQEIATLRAQKEGLIAKKATLGSDFKRLEYVTLPELYEKLTEKEDALGENPVFTEQYLETVGRPAYQKELKRLKTASAIASNFSSTLARSELEHKKSRDQLFQQRRRFAEDFKPCSYQIESMLNDEYEAERKSLEESKLPEYLEKMQSARESAMEQFQNDFLARLKSSIDLVTSQVRSLNRALRNAQFGTDRYEFKVERNPDYADYYDMIMDPALMQGDVGLFAMPFQQKYGSLIEQLFSQIVVADDSQMNAAKQTELEQNIARYTDFRTYLKFDLETTDQNGSRQRLSKTLNTKSGGETQTPFYIAVLASFAQIYKVNHPSDHNTVRLVVFDEAFNKMDGERITESIHLLRKMGLQAIVCAPPEKVADIMPLSDRTLLVCKDKYRMHVLPYGKEIHE